MKHRRAARRAPLRLATLALVSSLLAVAASATPSPAAAAGAGDLYAFGWNHFGQLGNSTNNETDVPNPTPTPVTLPGASGPATEVAAGKDHSLALTSTGQLYAFGENRFGQLGNTTNNETGNPNPTPTRVTLPGATGPVTQIAAGYDHSLALTSTGQPYAFGENAYGQLGNATNSNTEAPNPTPTPVDLGAGTTIDTMATGSMAFHSLVVVADLAVTTGSLPAGQVGAPYSATATASGGTPPYAWQASGLPAGLSIDPASGQIDGTPSAAGAFQVTLKVTDRFGIVATASIQYTVARAAQAISFAPLPDKAFGDPGFGLSASATSGLPVSFSSLTGSVCAVSAAAVRLLGAGACTIAADQPGDANYEPAPRVARTFAVAKAATAVILGASPSSGAAPGQAVQLAASVSGVAPSGSVAFEDGKGQIGQAPLRAGGQAKLTTRSLAPSRHKVRAIYSGDADNQGSASPPLTVRVAPRPKPRLRYTPNTPHQPNPRGGARYTFVFSDPAAGVRFQCRLDRRKWRRCSSPKAYRRLQRGRHVFCLRSIDRAGNRSAVRVVRFFAGRRR